MRLFGRERELERLRRLVGTARAVTVCGPAGVGKSRLVREALPDARCCSIAGGVPWISAIAPSLGVDPAAGDAGVRRALERIDVLALDGTIDAATLSSIAERCAVVTSARAPLGIDGEIVLRLAPLADEDALALWEHACRELGHAADRAIGRAIVRHLEGLPQAIEWMAARAAFLGDRACLERLEARAMPALDCALDSSLEGLDPDDRRVLEALAAFERGATAALLEPLVGDPLASLARLFARSLVRRIADPGAAPRVALYSAVLDAARKRAIANGTWSAIARRHAEVVLDACEADPRNAMAERAELEAIRARFNDELAVRASLALAAIEISEQPQAAYDRLAALPANALRARAELTLARFARRLAKFDLARRHVEAVLASGAHRVDALLEQAHLDRQESRLDEAHASHLRALAEAATPAERGVALGELGRMLQSLGRLREARERHVEANAIARSLGSPHREALERSLHARAVHRAGEVEEAVHLHEEALRMHVALGDRRLAAAERGHLAFTHHERGDLARAEALFRESIDGLAEVGDVFLEHVERVLLARLLIDLDRVEEARIELGIARSLLPSPPPRIELTWRLVRAFAALAKGELDAAREELAIGLASGPVLEVGFEALAPALLAWVEHRLGIAGAAIHLERAAPLIARVEHPGIRAAFAHLAERALGRTPPPIDPALLATSSDARRIAAYDEGSGLEVASDGRWFRAHDGPTVDLGRRSVPRRLLAALAAARERSPGAALSREQLLAAGWPGEKMRPDAADKRLRTAIWGLRKVGLAPFLLTRDEGYLLDPLVSCRVR